MKRLKECRGWKIILGIMGGMFLLTALVSILYISGDHIKDRIIEDRREKASAAGYREYRVCTPADDMVIDGITYRCYDVSGDEMFGGKLMIDKNISYKGADRMGKQCIYAKKTAHNDTGTIVEPYAAFPEPVLWDEAGWLVIAAIYLLPYAQAVMAAVLAVYLIIYMILRMYNTKAARV